MRLSSQNSFTQTVLHFLFHSMFFLFRIIAMAVAAAASSRLIVLSAEIKINDFK